ncbi:hypothetical protein DIPPA_26251 [Diplonema papillatum]|nr:hypothetical protein DIPPA_26251 [Diplonema papillatum]
MDGGDAEVLANWKFPAAVSSGRSSSGTEDEEEESETADNMPGLTVQSPSDLKSSIKRPPADFEPADSPSRKTAITFKERKESEPLANFEQDAKAHGYFDDEGVMDHSMKRKMSLPRVADLLPRLRELQKELTVTKTKEAALSKDVEVLRKENDALLKHLSRVHTLNIEALLREEKHARSYISWAELETTASLKLAAVVTEPEVLYASPRSPLGDVVRTRERAGTLYSARSFRKESQSRSSVDWTRFGPEEADLLLREKADVEDKLLSAEKLVSELEVSLLRRDADVSKLELALARADARVEKMLQRQKDSEEKAASDPPQNGQPLHANGTPANGVAHGLGTASPPYAVAVGPPFNQHFIPKFPPTWASGAMSHSTATPRSQSAPAVKRMMAPPASPGSPASRRPLPPGAVDVFSAVLPSVNGSYFLADRKEWAAGQPVWVSGAKKVASSPKGHWTIARNGVVVAKTKHPHAGVGPASAAHVWLALSPKGGANDWVARNLKIATRYRPPGLSPRPVGSHRSTSPTSPQSTPRRRRDLRSRSPPVIESHALDRFLLR